MANTYKRVGRAGLMPRSAEAKEIGDRFKAVRRDNGLTLAEVRRRTGFCLNTIRAHEAGSMPFRSDDLAKVACALSVRPTDLFVKEFNDDE